MELDDYPVGLLLEDLSHCPKGTGIYFYDDDSQEYYGIYPDEIRTDHFSCRYRLACAAHSF